MRSLTSDPSSLAGAIEPTTDEAAALAAAEAAAKGELPPGVVPATAVAGALTSDISKRPVIRRYEPMTREAATEAAMARGGDPASKSLHWALSGLPAPAGAAPAAKPAATGAAAKTEAAPAAPKCLEGVRKLPSATQGTAQPQAC